MELLLICLLTSPFSVNIVSRASGRREKGHEEMRLNFAEEQLAFELLAKVEEEWE